LTLKHLKTSWSHLTAVTVLLLYQNLMDFSHLFCIGVNRLIVYPHFLSIHHIIYGRFHHLQQILGLVKLFDETQAYYYFSVKKNKTAIFFGAS
jgi:hypothetical protein